jgi:hypothetical protein
MEGGWIELASTNNRGSEATGVIAVDSHLKINVSLRHFPSI